MVLVNVLSSRFFWVVVVFCIDNINILVPVTRKPKRYRIKTPASALTLLSVTSIRALLAVTTVCYDLFGTWGIVDLRTLEYWGVWGVCGTRDLCFTVTFHRSKGLKALGGGHSLQKGKLTKAVSSSSICTPKEFKLYVGNTCSFIHPKEGQKVLFTKNPNPDPTLIPLKHYGSDLLFWDTAFLHIANRKGASFPTL